jgi:hypothetical protein
MISNVNTKHNKNGLEFKKRSHDELNSSKINQEKQTTTCYFVSQKKKKKAYTRIFFMIVYLTPQ